MAAPRPEASRAPFPTDLEAFDQDDRIAFSRVDNNWMLEAEDGSEWEYDQRLKKWVPRLDEELVKQQQAAYAVPGVNEDEESTIESKKRKKEQMKDDLKAKKQRTGAGSQNERKNTSIYVTNIPRDATRDEIVEVFGKCGVIAEGTDSGEKRIKMYTDQQDSFKGEALITYFRPESIQIAIDMLHEADFRFGYPDPAGTMNVSKADFSSYSKPKQPKQDENGDEGQQQSSYRQKMKAKDKLKRLNNKLTDWDDDDPQVVQTTSSRWDKVAVLKHMFTLKELQEDPTAQLDIKEDIREECEKFGEVTNVVLFDKEEAGVVTVRFTVPEAAREAVRVIDGRSFGGQKCVAYIHSGEEKFKRSDHKGPKTEEEDQEEEERLKAYGDFLEKQQTEA